MSMVLDFIRAAAPWVAMGLVVAILAARGVTKRKGKKQDGDYGTEEMSLGMCFGILMGTAMGDNLGLGISLGALVGLAIGMCISKKSGDADQ